MLVVCIKSFTILLFTIYDFKGASSRLFLCSLSALLRLTKNDLKKRQKRLNKETKSHGVSQVLTVSHGCAIFNQNFKVFCKLNRFGGNLFNRLNTLLGWQRLNVLQEILFHLAQGALLVFLVFVGDHVEWLFPFWKTPLR